MQINTVLQNCINLKTNLVHITLESNRTKCINGCKGLLERVFRPQATRKGSLGIIFDNIYGPKICISYRKKCTESGCKNVFYYGYYISEEKGKILESKLNHFQSSECTFFHKKMFEEYGQWRLKDGIDISTYCDRFNYRFSDEFENLKTLVDDENIGRRDKSELKLCKNRFRDSFNFYELQKLVNDDLKEDFVISNEMSKALELEQKEKVLVPTEKRKEKNRNNDESKEKKQGMMFN